MNKEGIFKGKKEKLSYDDAEYADEVKKAIAKYGKKKMKKEELEEMIKEEVSMFQAKSDAQVYLQKAMERLLVIQNLRSVRGGSQALKAIDNAMNKVRNIAK